MRKISLVIAVLMVLTAATVIAQTPDTSAWVKFSSFRYVGVQNIEPAANEYLNPIIAGFYPDPSICRAGNDYYLVNSSFNYFPGLPIWHSTDLVNWTQIGNVFDRTSQFAIEGGAVQSGIYAPTIRYHEGTFYLVCTLVGGRGNFYVTATNPAGPWSEPIWLEGVGGIDPDIFFDDDGKCYVSSCDEPVGQAKYSGHRTIRMQEFDLVQNKPVGEKIVIVDGGTDITKEPNWCEAPHIYKVNGIYYLLCAEGGTEENHSAVIFKSESVKGPYVPWDKNPILTARDLPDDRPNPVTCTGHADFVQTQNGEWLAVFLACQPYLDGYFNTGRQTFMLPVTWANEWPIILPPKTPVPLTVKKPNLSAGAVPDVPSTGNTSFTENFESDTLHYRWMGLRRPDTKWYVTSPTEKALYMEPRSELVSGRGNPSFLAVRQQNNKYGCSVTLSVQPDTEDCVAGLMAFQNERAYYALNATIESGRITKIAIEKPAAGAGRGFRRNAEPIPPEILAEQTLSGNVTSIDLRITGQDPVIRVYYRIGSGEFIRLGGYLESSFLSTVSAGGFQGVTLGMFARN